MQALTYTIYGIVHVIWSKFNLELGTFSSKPNIYLVIIILKYIFLRFEVKKYRCLSMLSVLIKKCFFTST